MTCSHCGSQETNRRRRRSSLGFHTFARRACRRIFNERTGTPFNDLQYPTDIVLLAVSWRLRYKLGFRDVAELLLRRGCEVTHGAHPPMGAPLRTPARRPAARQTAGPRRRLLVARRDVREGGRPPV